ncbi:MAG TPA: M1 family metallopeptidase [Chthoniobacterales bacterium]
MRKPLALLLFGFIAANSQAGNTPSAQPISTELTKDIVPRSYFIHLEPNIETRVTEGVESIEIEVLKSTSQIVLNASETVIDKATLEIDDRLEELVPQFDATEQTVSFNLRDVLRPGKYALSIKFQSRIIEQPPGLVVQAYAGKFGSPEFILAIAPATTGQRRIFPCWDGPEFPATFQFSIKTGAQDRVVSNSPVLVEQPLGPEQKMVVLEKTPALASRVLYLMSGKIEWLDDTAAGIKLRIVTASGKKALGKYALETTKQLLVYFTDYFAMPFPLVDLDQIAFPSKTGEAAENWNGFFYDEDALLVGSETSYESTKQRIFFTVAQRIGRQWCANLPPRDAGNHFWLTEALASWMARKAADHFNPQWKFLLQTAIEKEEAMDRDSDETAQPIQSPPTGDELPGDRFDAVASQKPWLLLRMLEKFLGEDPFRDGVRAYLAKPSGANTESDDLWASLEHVTGKPVKKIVAGWTEQPGFPLIEITAQCLNGNRVISLEQVPFVLRPGGEAVLHWNVPVGIRIGSTNEVKYALLDKLTNNFDLAGCSGTIQANAGNVGYYRVLYEPALFNDLQKNVEKLPESDRVNLVTDTWALVESGNLPSSSYFDLLDSLGRDDSFAVWQNVLGTGETTGALRLIDHLEQGRPGREAYQRYICRFFGPKFRELGWDKRTGEKAETQDYRAILIETLGFFGDRDVIDESFKRFESYKENPSSLAPELRSAVVAVVGRYSSPTVYKELLSMANETQSVEEKRMYLRGLGAALDPETTPETLNYLWSNTLKPSDLSLTLEVFSTEGEHADIAWSFAVAHLKEVQDRFELLPKGWLLSSIAAGFTDNRRADEVLALAQADLSPATLRREEKSVQEIRFRAKLKAKTLPAIDDWIKAKLEAARDSSSQNP